MKAPIRNLLILLPALSAGLLFSGCFRSRADIARDNEEQEVRSTLQRSVYEQTKEVDGLREEIGRLEGRIEELEHQNKKEMSGLQSGREGTEKNVAALQQRIEELQKNNEALFEEIKKIKEDSLREAPPVVKKKGVVSFESALGSYKQKDFEEAADQFQAYLEHNPKSKKSMEARFYLGESLFQLKEYSEAIVELGVMHEKSPASPLGRKSTLRIAESFKALGKDKDARAFAQILIEKSPSSPEAKAARKLLR